MVGCVVNIKQKIVSTKRSESAKGKDINLKGEEIKISGIIILRCLLSLCSRVIYIIALEIYPLLLHFSGLFLVAIFCLVFISYHRIAISTNVYQFSLISIFLNITSSVNKETEMQIINISEGTDLLY